jgi:cobalt-zinc-cadmium efflux system protein
MADSGHRHASHGTVRNIKVAFWLNLSFTIIEIVGGLWTNSLAILSDAVHDFGDSLSLGLAWLLESLSRRHGDHRFSYGYRRFSLLGALLNTLILIGGSVVILTQAIPRIMKPEAAYAPGMAGLALLGIVINGFAVLRLRHEQALNARVVALHLLEDVLGWIAVLIVSIVLIITELSILDPILSIVITFYILFNTIRNLRQTLSLFLQAVPENIDLVAIDAKLRLIPEVLSTHHTHVWSMDGEHHVLTTHVVIDEGTSKDDIVCIRTSIQDVLRELAFSHTTVEIEFGDDDCGMAGEGG